MRKIFGILFLIFGFFLIEFLLFNFIGRNFVPNLLLIFVVFASLRMRMFDAFFVALLAGFVKDSYSISFLPINMISFVFCVFFVLFLRKYIYDQESPFSLLFMVLLTSIFYFVVQYLFYGIRINIEFLQAVRYVMAPELISTILVAPLILKQCKQCVFKLSV